MGSRGRVGGRFVMMFEPRIASPALRPAVCSPGFVHGLFSTRFFCQKKKEQKGEEYSGGEQGGGFNIMLDLHNASSALLPAGFVLRICAPPPLIFPPDFFVRKKTRK